MTIEKKKLPVTVANAQYRETKVEAYQNNPLILALAPQFDPSRFKKVMTVKATAKEFLDKSDGDRIEDIKIIRKMRIVTTQHLDLYNEIYELVSHGYVNRNPSRPEVVAWSYDIADSSIALEDVERPYESVSDQETTAGAIFVTGFTGNGKSTFSERILMNSFPMVIEHSWHDFSDPQIVFVKVDMPHDANRSELIYNILEEIDRILKHTSHGKTSYAEKCKTKSGDYIRISLMKKILFTVLNRHHVGLLVIDEFQNLQVASERYRREMIQLMATLSNLLAVPNIKIGTPDTLFLFDSKGSDKRRIGAIHELTRFSDDDWKRAIKAAFAFQPVSKPIEPSEGMINLLKDLTAGVPSIFMTLWESVLIEAVRSGCDKITQALIKRVFKQRFPMLRSVTRNINKGTKGRHADLLTVQQYLDSDNKPLALKHLQQFTSSAQVKGATTSAVVEDINAMVEQQNFSSSDLKKLDKIKNELKGKSQGEKLPQTLEHEE
jgi:hypothetical protein